jgi:hypothetical protein|tara:strand:- start:370 stop:1545 length:1176 start_codon:yes stop_codon:yes gene_type:complete
MALNKLTFNVNSAGLGTPLASSDHKSGIVYYNNTLPSGFSASDRIKTVFSLEEAEALGIVEGTAAHAVEWYHISQFFEKQPSGQLSIGYFAVPAGTPSFLEVKTLQDALIGEIRQMAVYFINSAYSATQVTAIQSRVTELQAEYKFLNVLYGADISGVSDLSTLATLRTLTAPNVSVCIGQDGNGKGAALYASKSYSITDLGAKLGAVAAANVNESISYIENFPMVTDGTEFDVVAFANGNAFLTTSVAQREALDDKGYLFLVKEIGLTGTFNNDSYTSVATTSDLATIENNRTIDKAKRLLRFFILPKLGSPLRVNTDGTLRPDTVATFKALAEKGLGQMETDRELSAYEVIINAAQNVVSTSKLELTVKIVPVGVAREIVINIGFVPKL